MPDARLSDDPPLRRSFQALVDRERLRRSRVREILKQLRDYAKGDVNVLALLAELEEMIG